MSISSLREGASLQRLTLVLLGFLALIALGGCIFDPDQADEGGRVEPAEFKIPLVDDGNAGRDQVIKNLENAYIELEFPEYEKLIHDDYVFLIDPAELGAVGSLEFGAAEDLESTRSMFNREWGEETLVDDDGNPIGEPVPVPPVDTIDLTLTPESASSWKLEQDGRFVGAWRRIYRVTMTVEYKEGARIDQIRGLQTFYVVASTQTRVVDDEEVELEVWQLLGWEDQGIDSVPN